MILAADVGGTKTSVGLFRPRGPRVAPVREAVYYSAEWPSVEALLGDFLGQGRQARVGRVAVGVAGPITDGRSQLVNLPWTVDAGRLRRAFDVDDVWVLNDLEATGWGLSALAPAQLASLTPRMRSREGHAALVAAGTGLGMALVVRDGKRVVVCPSEGGHQAFAPRDELEDELSRFVRERHGRASIERVLSGPGLVTIYRFLVESGRARESTSMRRRLDGAGDPAAAIGEAAVAGNDRTAVRALERFVSIYGAVAGDLALVARATGGVWVAGGIAPKILPALRGAGFIQAFRDKGRLTPLVARIPVKVVLEPRTALIGAAMRAAA